MTSILPSLPTDALLRARCNWRVDQIDASAPVVRTLAGILVPARALHTEYGRNIITSAGLALVLSRLYGTGSALTHMARGSSATAAAVGQTTLVTETERDALTSSVLSTTSLVLQYLEPSTANNGQVFREAGLFTASSGGTMFNRWVHTTITKARSIQILYSVTITVEEA